MRNEFKNGIKVMKEEKRTHKVKVKKHVTCGMLRNCHIIFYQKVCKKD